MMDFTRIIQKWQKQLTVKQKTGEYIKGRWVEAASSPKQFYGAFLSLTDKEIQYTESGSYSTQDKKLYVLEGLKDTEGNELLLKKGDIITDNDQNFEIDKELEAKEVVNYRKYIAKKKVIK